MYKKIKQYNYVQGLEFEPHMQNLASFVQKVLINGENLEGVTTKHKQTSIGIQQLVVDDITLVTSWSHKICKLDSEMNCVKFFFTVSFLFPLEAFPWAKEVKIQASLMA